MASSPPEHNMDGLGCRLGDRSGDLVLATEERLENITARSNCTITLAARRCPATARRRRWTGVPNDDNTCRVKEP
jgi:hypothetical protein